MQWSSSDWWLPPVLIPKEMQIFVRSETRTVSFYAMKTYITIWYNWWASFLIDYTTHSLLVHGINLMISQAEIIVRIWKSLDLILLSCIVIVPLCNRCPDPLTVDREHPFASKSFISKLHKTAYKIHSQITLPNTKPSRDVLLHAETKEAYFTVLGQGWKRAAEI